MSRGDRTIKLLATLLTAFMMAACAVPTQAEEAAPYDGSLRIEDGTLLPMCEYSNPRDPEYSNEESDILRFCVYVETDYDTDNDGMADLVKALVQVPRGAVEGKFKAATIYDPTPYGVGTYEEAINHPEKMFNQTPFDYSSLYRACEKRTPAGEMSSMDCAMAARPDRAKTRMIRINRKRPDGSICATAAIWGRQEYSW